MRAERSVDAALETQLVDGIPRGSRELPAIFSQSLDTVASTPHAALSSMKARMGLGAVIVFMVSCSGGADSPSPNAPYELGAVEIEGQLVAEPALEAIVEGDESESTNDSVLEEEGESNDASGGCGCGYVEPLPEVDSARPSKAGDVLVWFDRQRATLRIDGVTGDIVGHADDRRIFASGKEWTFESTRTEYPAALCPGMDSPETSDAWRGELVVGDERVEVIKPREATTDIGVSFNEFADLQASIGPYVFLSVNRSQSRCGAERVSEDKLVVFDLERRTFVDPASEVTGWDAAITLARAQVAKAKGPAVERVIVPRFTENGLAFVRRISWNTQPDNWLALGQAIELDPEPNLVPRSLAPYAKIPAGLAAFRMKFPQYDVGGFSLVTP